MQRFFGGSIAHLFIYDTPLTAEQMQEVGNRTGVTAGGNAIVKAAGQMTCSGRGPHACGCFGWQRVAFWTIFLLRAHPNGAPCAASSHPSHPQIYSTGQRSMAAMNASASPPNSGDTRTRSVGSGGALQQQAQQLSSDPTQLVQQDPAASAQPAADCVTPCEAYNGALVCFTSSSQIRLCTGGSSLGSSDSNSGTLDSPAGFTSADPSSAFQPATDCVSTCEQLNDTWVCYTTTSEVRDCLPVDALAAMDSGLQSTVLADSPANSSGSQQAAAQLGGQPLCSAMPIEGAVDGWGGTGCALKGSWLAACTWKQGELIRCIAEMDV